MLNEFILTHKTLIHKLSESLFYYNIWMLLKLEKFRISITIK